MKKQDLNIQIVELTKKLELLERENNLLKKKIDFDSLKKTVIVPESFKSIFDIAEKNVSHYFSDIYNSSENGEINISGERYILIRSASLSYEFLEIIKELYSNKGEAEAIRIGNNFLFDIGHVLGKKDAKSFHDKMRLTDPIHKLSAGPVHFAYTGWANVEILADSNPSQDENFVLKYHHHNSFEAQSWKKAKKISDKPVCVMNAGYSSGWCEESFGIPLTAIELTCEAKGDDRCTFIMAPSNKISEYLKEYESLSEMDQYDVPVFFKRKIAEDKLRESLEQKEVLFKEVHHRVKNNLQIISSLFKLQLNTIQDEGLRSVFLTSLNRVNSMAQIHELIYMDKNLSVINIEQYFVHLLSSLKQLYSNNSLKIKIDIELEDKGFDPDKVVPLGLILNEIASNALKYCQVPDGQFNLSFKEENGSCFMNLSDNGPGLPKDLDTKYLGLSLIEILCSQLDAELVVDSSKKGLAYSIIFKK